MSHPIQYASYLIRLWREIRIDEPASVPDWQSEIEHIQTGQRWTFDTLDELLGHLRRQAEGSEWNAPIYTGGGPKQQTNDN